METLGGLHSRLCGAFGAAWGVERCRGVEGVEGVEGVGVSRVLTLLTPLTTSERPGCQRWLTPVSAVSRGCRGVSRGCRLTPVSTVSTVSSVCRECVEHVSRVSSQGSTFTRGGIPTGLWRTCASLGPAGRYHAHGWAWKPYGWFDPAPRPRDIIHTYIYGRRPRLAHPVRG